MIRDAKKLGFSKCDVFDRERLRIPLDSPEGFALRFQYLGITLSEAEQASFFARWGDDINSLISRKFQVVEESLARILFMHESSRAINHLDVDLQFKRPLSGIDVGHFRAFCSMWLKEPKRNTLSVLFGAADRPIRFETTDLSAIEAGEPGIVNGIGGASWKYRFDLDVAAEESEETAKENSIYERESRFSSVGRESVEFLNLSYGHDGMVRYFPTISLQDIDEASWIVMMNKSLADELHAIHLYSNGYKLMEVGPRDFRIDSSPLTPFEEVPFTHTELTDPWVRIRPTTLSSAFKISFSRITPKRLFDSALTSDSLAERQSKPKDLPAKTSHPVEGASSSNDAGSGSLKGKPKSEPKK